MPDNYGTQVYVISIRWSRSGCKQLDFWDDHTNITSWLKEHADKWIIQKEDTVNNLHYQGYAKLKQKIRPKQLAKELNDPFTGIEIQPASNNGKMKLQDYAMKIDTRVDGPWCDHILYLGADLPHTLWPWQQFIKESIEKPPDDRTILWIYDPQGNSGKSKLAKYLQFHHDVLTLQYGESKDLLNIVYQNAHKPAYMFDLTRMKPKLYSTNDLYATIESIKNGYFINTKYQTGTMMMNPPHVVCLSNQLPKWGDLSKDRWQVYMMTIDKELHKVKETDFEYDKEGNAIHCKNVIVYNPPKPLQLVDYEPGQTTWTIERQAIVTTPTHNIQMRQILQITPQSQQHNIFGSQNTLTPRETSLQCHENELDIDCIISTPPHIGMFDIRQESDLDEDEILNLSQLSDMVEELSQERNPYINDEADVE